MIKINRIESENEWGSLNLNSDVVKEDIGLVDSIV